MTTSIPKRRSITDAVFALVSTISPVNDYRTLYNRFTYWQDVDTEYNLNHLTVRDTASEIELTNRQQRESLSFVVDAIIFSEDAGNAGTDAIADIIEVLGTDETLGGLAQMIVLNSTDKDIETEGRTRVLVSVEFDVIYRTGRFAVN